MILTIHFLWLIIAFFSLITIDAFFNHIIKLVELIELNQVDDLSLKNFKYTSIT